MKGLLHRNRSFLYAALMLFFVRGTFADQYRVPSGSMEPTIHVGDHILVDKTAYNLRLPFSDVILRSTGEPERGDIVVFLRPSDGTRMVKRLIGLPGDHIQIHDGFLTINGEPVPGTAEGFQALKSAEDDEVFYLERFAGHLATIKRTRSLLRPESLDITVPSGQYFAMGDNRDNSADSRSWGFFPREAILGRARAVAFNLDFSPLPVPDLARVGKVLE